MSNEKYRYDYNSLDEARGVLDSLAVGRVIDDWSLRGRDMNTWKHIVWNQSDDNPAAVVSPGYNLLQHREFFGKFLNAVEDVDYSIDTIEVVDERERAYMHVLFNETWLDDEIKAGIRAGNSFDKGRSAFVEFYALRLVCTNGLMGRKVFGRRSRIHVGDWETEVIVQNVKEIIPKSKQRLEELVDSSQEDFINTDLIRPLLRSIGFSKGLSDRVHNKYNDLGEVDLWELYNGVTYEVENNKDVRESYREGLHSKANDILVKSSDSLVNMAENELEENSDSDNGLDIIDDEVLQSVMD